MPLANFSNLDFNQVKTTLRDYLKSNSTLRIMTLKDRTYRRSLMCWLTILTLPHTNANMVANEVFIDSATLRENVVALARNMDMFLDQERQRVPRSVFSLMQGDISPNPVSITLKKGPVAATSGSFGNQSFVFSILEDITVPVFDGIAL